LSCLPKRASGKPASSSSSAARTEKCQSVGNVIGLGKIKDGNGDFFQLTGLIKAALAESSWNLPRNVRKQIESLRDLGHTSAHNRYYLAKQLYIDELKGVYREAIEAFLHIANLL
jgi:hypothetical protein